MKGKQVKKLSYKLLAGLVFIVGNSALAYSADEHATEAEKHLEKSVESGNKGDAAGAASHANEAEQHIIEENAKTPYTTNDLKKADEQVLTAAKFKTGRGGTITEKKYSDTKPK